MTRTCHICSMAVVVRHLLGLEEPSDPGLDKADAVEAFETSMRAIIEWHDQLAIDLRECALRHPAFGLFDGAQWLLFAAVHAQQHRGQLLDLKHLSDTAAEHSTP
jgi:DinB superfamily